MPMEPTARGDLVAEKVRRWYEANRESWWDRHHVNFLGRSPDRDGTHADEFMLRLIGAVYQADRDVGE